MRKISKVKILPGYSLDLTFDDGTTGMVDLSNLVGKGVFVLWRDHRVFENVQIGPSGELSWGDRIDLCPDSLYLRVTGKSPRIFFPRSATYRCHDRCRR